MTTAGLFFVRITHHRRVTYATATSFWLQNAVGKPDEKPLVRAMLQGSWLSSSANFEQTASDNIKSGGNISSTNDIKITSTKCCLQHTLARLDSARRHRRSIFTADWISAAALGNFPPSPEEISKFQHYLQQR